MRILVFFDLPTATAEHRRAYTKFRKFLLKSGFMMLQESVYCKLALNGTAVRDITNSIHKNSPEEGLVQLLTVTEKQYSNTNSRLKVQSRIPRATHARAAQNASRRLIKT